MVLQLFDLARPRDKGNLGFGSCIVSITSAEGLFGSFGASAYAAAKAAMHNLTKTLANNLGPKGIRVNAVAAGWIAGVMDTDSVLEPAPAKP